MTCTESNTVEQMVIETLAGLPAGPGVAEEEAVYGLPCKMVRRKRVTLPVE